MIKVWAMHIGATLRVLGWLGALLFTSVITAQPIDFGRYHALVIGNDDYQDVAGGSLGTS